MKPGKIQISGTGCCLVDRLYNNISFNSENIAPYLSRQRGDGGLTPGQLVFQEELEKFAQKDFQTILQEITLGRSPNKINVGGPAIVALIHAAQIDENSDCIYQFFGSGGNDQEGEFLLSSLRQTPVQTDKYQLSGILTPSTVVLSDPEYNRGQGERIFINSIGAAWNFLPEKLDRDFFSSDITIFGGTALVPKIHDNLSKLLEKAKSNGCITIVNTVFDFRSEKAHPEKRWPLGENDDSYHLTDLLIMDHEEALRLSGEAELDAAFKFFRQQGTGAVIVTNGSENIRVFSDGRLFLPLNEIEMPVSSMITNEIGKNHSGDTTGCGDNFAGGIIASIASQLSTGEKILDLTEAVSWGIVSGGFACFYLGGTYMEGSRGEKRSKILPYYDQFIKQIHGQ